MERVEQRLRKVTSALNAAKIPYAVVGGNAVAVWVAKVDPAATRTTKDVDLLVDAADLERITAVMSSVGFEREDLRSLILFLDPEERNRKSGVHLVWAGQKVRPSYLHEAPKVEEAVFDDQGFWVLGLASLVRMKLTSFRDIDRVHIADLLRVDVIDREVRQQLPADLLAKLVEVEAGLERE